MAGEPVDGRKDGVKAAKWRGGEIKVVMVFLVGNY